MKCLWVFLAIVIAIVLAFAGMLAGADPEGRGGKLATTLFDAATVALVLAAGLSMYLW